MAASRMEIARGDIVECFGKLGKRVLARADIERVVAENRGFWRLARATTVREFIEFMLEKTDLRAAKFGFPSTTITRYTWGTPSVYELALSLKPEAYFTHYSAMYLHELTLQVPKTVYLNCEQPPKAKQGTQIDQRSIDVAFGRKPRKSGYVALYEGYRICILSGMHTSRLGVIEIKEPNGEVLQVTGIERTLIDIAVRPFYSGGVAEVLRAYQMARGRVSINKLAAMLKKAGYVYPYHQAIGFYLEKSGYKASQLDLLRKFPMSFDFYLTYEMGKDAAYSPDWHLHFPKGL